MSHRLLLVCCSLLAALALAAPAQAAFEEDPPTVPVPVDAPAVASTASGATVLAWVRGAEVCTVLVEPGAPRPASAHLVEDDDAPGVPPGGCTGMRVTSRFDGGMIRHVTMGGTTMAWGYGGLDTAQIALKADGQVIAAAPTGPSALLPARAGELRFWVMAVPPLRIRLDAIAMLDAAGAVRRAVDPVDFGASTLFFHVPPSRSQQVRRTLLRHGRVGRRSWRLWDEATAGTLAPTPLLPERTGRKHCLEFEVQTRSEAGPQSASSENPCEELLTAGMPMVATVDGDCAVGTHVEVLARATVRRVVVVLGDGTRRALGLATLGDGLRGGTLVVGHGMALRRALALGADGRTLVVQPLASAPSVQRGGTDCAPAWTAFPWAYMDHLPLGAGARVPHAVDHGLELCATVGAVPRIPEDCALPPTDPSETHLHLLPTADGRYLFGVVPAEIAAARITFADRTTRTVAAEALPGYTGLYAGVLRAIAVDLPGPRAVERVQLVDDRARVLEQAVGGADPHPYGPAVTVLAAADGAPAVVAAPVRRSGRAVTCVALGALRRLEDCAESVPSRIRTGLGTAWIHVLCAPRRSVVTAVLRGRGDQLVVRTTGGRVVRARSAAFPAAAGPAGKGLRFARAVLGPRDAVGTLLVRRRNAQRFPLSLPPAGRQCGYADGPGFWLSLGAE